MTKIVNHHILLLLLSLLLNPFLAIQQGTAQNTTRVTGNNKLKIVDFSGIESIINQKSDTTYIINFWATWCAPCIKELPHFQKIHDKYSNQKIRVLLISLDFEKQVESKVVPFIRKNKLTPEVIVLNDPKSHIWIDKVDKSWSGAIPATLFINNKKRAFYEKEFEYNELELIVKGFLTD